ncbi:MAG: hypothetical protein JWM34_3074 [Ilumatobacteraceae bacterium]|nr:hypothetical protein [Ilumatobacteraceae bacterium]
MCMRLDTSDVQRLFARQHGVAIDRQLRAAGISLKQQKVRLDAGEWRRVHPGVIALAGMRSTFEQWVMAASLATNGGLACGPTAARLLRFDGFAAVRTVEVVVPETSRAPSHLEATREIRRSMACCGAVRTRSGCGSTSSVGAVRD